MISMSLLPRYVREGRAGLFRRRTLTDQPLDDIGGRFRCNGSNFGERPLPGLSETGFRRSLLVGHCRTRFRQTSL
jgi:hypothetical protein